MTFRVLIFSLLIAVCAARPAQGDDFEPRPIERIVFTHTTNLKDRELLRNLPVQVGTVLNKKILDDSIAELYSRMIFEHVDAEVRRVGDRYEVEYSLIPIVRVGAIIFDEVADLEERRLRGATGIRLGSRFSLSKLLDSIERLQKYLRERGYFSAFIRVAVVDRRGTQDVTLRYEMVFGERSTITEVTYDGEFPDAVRSVQQRLTAEYLGNAASREQVRAFAQELRSQLRAAGYWQASVRIEDVVHIPPTGARVRIRVVARDPFWVTIEGNTVFSEEELLLPLRLKTRTVPLTPGAVSSFCDSVEERYHRYGYFFVNVQCGTEVEREGGGYVIRITEGRQYVVRSIEVLGADQLSSDQIRDEMKTVPQPLWPARMFSPGFLQLTQLAEDVESIKALYRREGFPEVEVSSEFAVAQNNQLEVTIRVREGNRRRVQAVTLEFSPIPDSPELSDILAELEPGSIYSPESIETERVRLEAEIRERGYPNVRVESSAQEDEGVVRFVANAGLPVEVGVVRTRGNVWTRDSVLRSAVGVKRGDPWRPSEIEKGANSLAATGLFREVGVQPTDGVLDSPIEDLVIDVDERDTGVFDAGVELDTEDGLHLTGEVGQRNLGGRGESLTFMSDIYLRTGDQLIDSGRVRGLYHKPSAFSRDSDLYAEVFAQYDINLIDEYSFNRIGFLPTYRDQLSEDITVDFGPMILQERLFDVREDVIISDLDEGRALYTFLRGQLELDLRDDSFNPRTGFYTLVSTRLASSALGSDADLISLSIQQSVFTSLNDRMVWANNIRGSLIRGYGDTSVVPLSQRIFLGGRNSLRGFTRNKIGPRGIERNIAGGDTSLVFNTELQYDVVQDLVGVFFLDVGQSVLEEKGSFQGDPQSFSRLRYSPGIGVRYRTPIGPLSAEYGVAMDREFGERFGRLNINLGNAF